MRKKKGGRYTRKISYLIKKSQVEEQEKSRLTFKAILYYMIPLPITFSMERITELQFYKVILSKNRRTWKQTYKVKISTDGFISYYESALFYRQHK